MKAKLSYKLFALFTFIASAFCFCLPVSAASFSMTASATQVAPGAKITVSVGGDFIGRVKLKATGGTLSQSAIWVEENRQTITVTAGNSGTITVTATPEPGFSNSDGDEYKPGSRTVSIKIIAPAQTTTPQPSTGANTSNPTKPQTPNKPQGTTTTTKPSTSNNQDKKPEETPEPEENAPEEPIKNEEDSDNKDQEVITEEDVETNITSCKDSNCSFPWILVGILTACLCGVTTALVCVLVARKTPPQQTKGKKGAKHEKAR